eukprot:scaffold1646_cov384-Prasinococcus_capsulatus_cf.AAC.2
MDDVPLNVAKSSEPCTASSSSRVEAVHAVQATIVQRVTRDVGARPDKPSSRQRAATASDGRRGMHTPAGGEQEHPTRAAHAAPRAGPERVRTRARWQPVRGRSAAPEPPIASGRAPRHATPRQPHPSIHPSIRPSDGWMDAAADDARGPPFRPAGEAAHHHRAQGGDGGEEPGRGSRERRAYDAQWSRNASPAAIGEHTGRPRAARRGAGPLARPTQRCITSPGEAVWLPHTAGAPP